LNNIKKNLCLYSIALRIYYWNPKNVAVLVRNKLLCPKQKKFYL